MNIISFEQEGNKELWEQQCLPIGNGYMGASMFGGVREERIVLNEKSLWAGGPCQRRKDYYGGNKRDRYKYVKEVQEQLAAGNYQQVTELLPELTGDGDFGTYLLLCDAVLEFDLPEGEPQGYMRYLDIVHSVYNCSYSVGRVNCERSAFASYPDRVIVFKFGTHDRYAEDDRLLNFRLRLDKTHPAKIYGESDTLVYSGAVEDNGMRFDARFKVETDGTLDISEEGIRVSGASRAVIYFCAATDYAMKYPTYRSGVAPEEITVPAVENAAKMGYGELYKAHYADYSEIFNRVSLRINKNPVYMPADRLLEEYKKGNRAAMDQLEMLYFQYGRYLLISSSREGALPANLQGVWNESNTPPWCCDYHINVNLQMNYWGAYNTNMAETALPLVEFLDSLREPGRVTAKEYYNIASDGENPENGWTAHTQCSPFGWTAPGWDFYWGWSTAAVAWLMQNIWEYYEFTGDAEYLREKIFPIMRESARFYTQWLIYDEKQDRLVSSPTYSPEHGPASIGNTYEQSLIEQLFVDFLKASETVGEEGALQEKVREMLPRLKPYSVSKTGLLKEWFEEDEEDFDRSKIQKNHRHISHLMGLYPGKRINSQTPEIMRAAIATMDDRGDESTG
ncbi:MAG: glycoside hydrolase N-terminal domain-containing protein, partial [Oscillospiraceae bacterium]|nr:glycoside hydrolase N-terminal domain-containing protein [Oscillospiraceae bacterium]